MYLWYKRNLKWYFNIVEWDIIVEKYLEWNILNDQNKHPLLHKDI